MNKYKIEIRSYGETKEVFETSDFEIAKSKYREFDELSYAKNYVTLLFIDNEKIRFEEAEKLVYSVEERRKRSEKMTGEYLRYGNKHFKYKGKICE